MENKFEKHQRDYTMLISSKVAKEILSKEFIDYFSYKFHPIFILIEDRVFYHYILEKDYENLPNFWIKKRNLADLIAYDKKIGKILIEFKKFLRKRHDNPVASIENLNVYSSNFIGMILLSAYLPMSVRNLDVKMMKLGLKLRKKYEDAHKLANSLQKKLLNKLEAKFNVEKDTLEYLTDNEFRKFISNGKMPKNIKDRKKFFFIEYSTKGEKVYSKSEAIKKIKTIDKDYKKKFDVDSFNGSIAFSGLAKGRVKIIRRIEEANGLRKGAVLVASMTDPRYLPAMKKAAAFVTDEGGITCHAAIVARELKKPCIIGTKIATQVLKDGDLVQVDANKGTVKILK